jgi:creatinine amidohydrolase
MGTDTDRNFIEHLTWDEVARRVGGGAAAILPIGAAAKQHGFHLPLNTDRIQAEWFAARLTERFDALIWPTVTYGYYPAFTEYAGSSSLSASTFEAVVHEIAAGILDSGGRKLLVLDTGISTRPPVERALARLDTEKVLHLPIHEGPHYRRAAEGIAEQRHGSHADELETSLMLALAPLLVDMARAETSPALNQASPGRLTPTDKTSPNYSRSGSYGDPTLATPAKGEILLAAILNDLAEQAAAFMTDKSAATRRSHATRGVTR